MARFEALPEEYSEARPALERMLLAQTVADRRLMGSRRRPQPPRNLIAQKGTSKCTLTWNAPADDRGITGWRVYVGNETTLFAAIDDFETRKVEIPLAGNQSKFAAVSSVNALGVESVKMPTIIQSNTDQYVVSGTGGGTDGTSPTDPPEWPSEKSGGMGEPTVL